MKIAVLGASGWIGSHIAQEAKARGHEVVAVVRNASRVEISDVEVRSFDLQDEAASLTTAFSGVDAVIASIGGRALGNHDIVKNAAAKLLDTLPSIGIERLLWVGGAGSLEVAPNVPLVTVPAFPAEHKNEALAQGEALEVFKQSNSEVNWTFISPAAEIFPGEKLSTYRTGGDQLLTDQDGNSKISVSDYAIAMIDELEAGKFPRQRIGVAY
ncbi:NAD(P)-dependent oxidoreductase [Vibrio coralliirubri]|uniref:NAD(P)-dependent oxidoreductase n=1 Tax=Vibrio coralliirubri TaxID=1516159 RepID=UPI000633506F|nr:NAD(P)-dependent oxidoreductase [Vibrio coralliirubri]CDT51861.1 Putative NADH-flavin reductase [Vibrio coralliirubri]CDT99731.1 Putative NADH-flavin reductase [Vibrio coralliirubri]